MRTPPPTQCGARYGVGRAQPSGGRKGSPQGLGSSLLGPRTADGSLATRGHPLSRFRGGGGRLDPRRAGGGLWGGLCCGLREPGRTVQPGPPAAAPASLSPTSGLKAALAPPLAQQNQRSPAWFSGAAGGRRGQGSNGCPARDTFLRDVSPGLLPPRSPCFFQSK